MPAAARAVHSGLPARVLDFKVHMHMWKGTLEHMESWPSRDQPSMDWWQGLPLPEPSSTHSQLKEGGSREGVSDVVWMA